MNNLKAATFEALLYEKAFVKFRKILIGHEATQINCLSLFLKQSYIIELRICLLLFVNKLDMFNSFSRLPSDVTVATSCELEQHFGNENVIVAAIEKVKVGSIVAIW